MKLEINGDFVSLAALRSTWEEPVELTLTEAAREQVATSHAQVAKVVASGDTVYGVNTGFGQLAKIRISDDELGHLQENLIRSHAVGIGDRLPDDRFGL